MDSKKNLWMGIGAVVVLALIVWMVTKGDSGIKVPLEEDMTTENEVVIEPKEDRTKGSVNTAVPVAPLSYQEALNKYADARIQIGVSCQVTPANSTYKNGTTLMLDNRTSESKDIKLGTAFSIAPYSFKLVKLESANLPATWLMDCDNMRNVATVFIQK